MNKYIRYFLIVVIIIINLSCKSNKHSEKLNSGDNTLKLISIESHGETKSTYILNFMKVAIIPEVNIDSYELNDFLLFASLKIEPYISGVEDSSGNRVNVKFIAEGNSDSVKSLKCSEISVHEYLNTVAKLFDTRIKVIWNEPKPRIDPQVRK